MAAQRKYSATAWRRLGAAMRHSRILAGWTQADLVYRSGTSMSTVQDREGGRMPSGPGIPPKTTQILRTLGWPDGYAEQVLLGVFDGPPDVDSRPVVPLAESDTRTTMWRMAQRLRGERGSMTDDEQIKADLVELIHWASTYLAELNRPPGSS